MRKLVALAVVLAAAWGVFLFQGLPAIERMRQAHADLLRREQDVSVIAAQQPPVSPEEFAELAAQRERQTRSAGTRLAALTGGGQAPPRASLEEELSRSRLEALGPDDKLTMAVRAQAATSPEADAALAAIVRALSSADGVEVGALALKNDGRLQPVAGVPQLQQMEAQLVLTAGVPEALTCLEALAPQRDGGLPVLSVVSSSMRRIEPERWGNRLEHFAGPPAQLSVSLAILFAAPGGT